MSNSVQPQRQQPTKLPRPWDSPGKNTGVGCHFLLQCKQVKSESEVTQSIESFMDFSPKDNSFVSDLTFCKSGIYLVDLFLNRECFEFWFDRQCCKTSSPFSLSHFLRVISKESFIIVSLWNLLLEFLRTCSVVKFYYFSSFLWEHFHHRGSLRSLFVYTR